MIHALLAEDEKLCDRCLPQPTRWLRYEFVDIKSNFKHVVTIARTHHNPPWPPYRVWWAYVAEAYALPEHVATAPALAVTGFSLLSALYPSRVPKPVSSADQFLSNLRQRAPQPGDDPDVHVHLYLIPGSEAKRLENQANRVQRRDGARTLHTAASARMAEVSRVTGGHVFTSNAKQDAYARALVMMPGSVTLTAEGLNV